MIDTKSLFPFYCMAREGALGMRGVTLVLVCISIIKRAFI